MNAKVIDELSRIQFERSQLAIAIRNGEQEVIEQAPRIAENLDRQEHIYFYAVIWGIIELPGS